MNNDRGPRIAFIGGGNMARALIGGLLRQGVPAARLRVGEPQPQARQSLEREFAIATSADNGVAIDAAEVAVLAVKPQQAPQVLKDLAGALRSHRPLLLSIVAGLRIADLSRLCPSPQPVVRAMPNRPALLGAGITGLYAAAPVTAAQRGLAEQIARAAGRFVWLRSEAELDIVTALSGSGPAYFFLLAERLASAATALGLEPQTAQLLAAETLFGSGALAHEPASLAAQRHAVSSRGGTTEAALAVLAAGGFDGLITAALRASAARSVELADAAAAALDSDSSAPRS